MNTKRKLAFTRIGDTVSIQGIPYKIESIRNSETYEGGIEPDTVRRHPERIRSKYLVRLRDKKTGRLKNTWFGEFISCEIVDNLIITDHAKQRQEERKITDDDLNFVVKFGRCKESLGRYIFHLEKDDLRGHDQSLQHLAGLNVVMHNNMIVTTYRTKK